MADKSVFQRHELKYILTKEQKQRVLDGILPYMKLDQYGRTTIRNIYFDTDDYRLQTRGGKGVKAGVFNVKTGKLASLKIVSEQEDVMIITSNGTIIRVAALDISKIGRDTQGVRIMRIADSTVSKIAITPKGDEENEETTEEVEE